MALKLVCLGVGKGATNFLTGQSSTAYAITSSDNTPLLLMDCGSGVGRAVTEWFDVNGMPRDIYLSHNHTDHAGDLPVYLALTQARATGRPRLYGHPDVLDIIRHHRLHELAATGFDVDAVIDWIKCDANGWITTEHFALRLVRSAHSYLCYGFVLLVDGNAVLGWSSDCRFDRDIYETLAQAPTVIVHGRDRGNSDHASFDDIDAFAATTDARLWISHYERTDYSFRSPNAALLTPGQILDLSS